MAARPANAPSFESRRQKVRAGDRAARSREHVFSRRQSVEDKEKAKNANQNANMVLSYLKSQSLDLLRTAFESIRGEFADLNVALQLELRGSPQPYSFSVTKGLVPASDSSKKENNEMSVLTIALAGGDDVALNDVTGLYDRKATKNCRCILVTMRWAHRHFIWSAHDGARVTLAFEDADVAWVLVWSSPDLWEVRNIDKAQADELLTALARRADKAES